jgi:hypothetical protein
VNLEDNMRKQDELAFPNSCLNKAKDDEMLFVLLGRDKAVPDTIRFWCQMRVKRKLNTIGDPQIVEALRVADEMEAEQHRVRRA